MSNEQSQQYLLIFGKKLKMIRIKAGYTQSQLCKETKMEKRQLGRIERGEINTGIMSIRKISIALDLPVINFFDFKY